ncbi:hypothetical protein FHX09_004538 [Rhizobium sp. BK538]|nr:hypothetical protein [Rhizobium sp. BK060]MBB4170658.1 hypothetical protein [Rhizobium sp. BK538]TCM77017.1 hypothetical protein EV291_10834 [Rhizobium sp. BK068]
MSRVALYARCSFSLQNPRLMISFSFAGSLQNGKDGSYQLLP